MKPAIKSSKLPRWVTFFFPYKHEGLIMAVIVATIFYPLLGIIVSLREFYIDFCSISLMIFLCIGLFFIGALWVFHQIEILYALRTRFIIHYRTTTDEEEKLRTKERLKDLCIKV